MDAFVGSVMVHSRGFGIGMVQGWGRHESWITEWACVSVKFTVIFLEIGSRSFFRVSSIQQKITFKWSISRFSFFINYRWPYCTTISLCCSCQAHDISIQHAQNCRSLLHARVMDLRCDEEWRTPWMLVLARSSTCSYVIIRDLLMNYCFDIATRMMGTRWSPLGYRCLVPCPRDRTLWTHIVHDARARVDCALVVADG